MLSSTEMTGMKKLAIGSCAELHCRHCRSSEVFLPYAWLGARRVGECQYCALACYIIYLCYIWCREVLSIQLWSCVAALSWRRSWSYMIHDSHWHDAAWVAIWDWKVVGWAKHWGRCIHTAPMWGNWRWFVWSPLSCNWTNRSWPSRWCGRDVGFPLARGRYEKSMYLSAPILLKSYLKPLSNWY